MDRFLILEVLFSGKILGMADGLVADDDVSSWSSDFVRGTVTETFETLVDFFHRLLCVNWYGVSIHYKILVEGIVIFFHLKESWYIIRRE